MARLSKEEQSLLKKLQAKSEAPDPGPVGRSVSVHVDLSDPAQVALARKHGFLDGDDDDDGGEDEAPPEDDETPKRRGYFDS